LQPFSPKFGRTSNLEEAAAMIYECEHCEEQLYPNTLRCHRCGQLFDTLVPSDALPPPSRPWPFLGEHLSATTTIILPQKRGNA